MWEYWAVEVQCIRFKTQGKSALRWVHGMLWLCLDRLQYWCPQDGGSCGKSPVFREAAVVWTAGLSFGEVEYAEKGYGEEGAWGRTVLCSLSAEDAVSVRKDMRGRGPCKIFRKWWLGGCYRQAWEEQDCKICGFLRAWECVQRSGKMAWRGNAIHPGIL